MKRMYLVTKSIYTMFLSEETSKAKLEKDAAIFLKEEADLYSGHRPLVIKEITRPDEIPDDWTDSSLLWGTEEEITPTEFLLMKSEENKKEYQEYLRLKAKFEPAVKCAKEIF